MYTKEELKAASNIIKKIAREHHVPEARVRLDMEEAMNAARSSPDPAVQARWAVFSYAGTKPTLEEFILWASKMTDPSGEDR